MVSTPVTGACDHPGCKIASQRTCSACSRSFCRRHVALEYGGNYSFYRCAACRQRLDSGSFQTTLLVAGLLVMTGLLLFVILGPSAGGLIGLAITLGACSLLGYHWRRL